MYDLIALLVSLILMQPLQAGIEERLEAARAPQAVVQQVAQCAAAATPASVDRAWSDPWWAVTTVVGVWVGTASSESVLSEAAPAPCGPAIAAARPFLGRPTG